MTPQELKNSILQLAIQGKLVEQRSEEGTAEELLAQIQQEKQKLIAVEKIKKEKALPEITDDEKPFDIPVSWKWVRLAEFATLHNGRAYKQNELLAAGKYPVLRVGNLFTNNQWYYSNLDLEPEKYCIAGDLLYSWSASFGPYIWEGSKSIYHYHIWKIDYSNFIDRSYLFFMLLADTEQIKKSGHGLAMVHVTKAGMEKRLFPIPPLAEQKRIVAKIEELLPYIDRYEQAWSKLEQFNSRFPEDMKKSLLQYAIQGKLVEQRPEEGTAEELFAQIQQEKQRLIADKKVKKEKPLPEITDDEKPFDIPESWKWVRVQEIACLNPKNVLPDELEVSFIPMALVDEGYHNNHSSETRKWGTIKKGFTHFTEGDIGIAKITPCFQNRKSVVFHNLKNGYGAGTTELSIVRVVNESVSRDYLLWFFKSAYFIDNGVKSFTDTAGQQRINKDYLSMCCVPLPPLAEQKRIVEKLEKLLPLCEQLKGFDCLISFPFKKRSKA